MSTAEEREASELDAERNVLSQPTIGVVAILASVCCWGTVPVLLRNLSQTTEVDAWTANGFRYPFAAILYWPVLIYFAKKGDLNLKLFGRCLVPSCFSFAGQIFWALAPYYLTAGAVGFLVRSSLVFSLLGSAIFFVEERRLLAQPRFYGGLLVTIGGFVAFSFAKGTIDLSTTGTGILIISLCSLFFGIYVVSVRAFLKGVNPILAFAVVSQFVSIGVLIAMATWGDASELARINARAWIELVVSALLGIAMGHVFLYLAIQHLGPSLTTSCQSIIPFATAGIAMLYLGERLSAWQWCTGLVMIFGVTVLLSARKR